MDIKITVRKEPEGTSEGAFRAYAYTEGFGVNAEGHSESKALYALHKKLKQMNKFAMIARVALETKLGWHNCIIKFHK